MYGFSKQTLSMLLKDLEIAVRSNVTHISIYDLEVILILLLECAIINQSMRKRII